ncbi:MAG: peptide chain release factor N(5)-glutamine methyltransferase [Candidatus Moranbacteria bacterium]|nr:peptide chain release factor N(5)-glutamine methyltransferase [Candidatus Moranbacteria bacterium]
MNINIKEILQSTLLSPLDTEILLSLAVNKPKEYLFSHPEKKLNKPQILRYKFYVARRLSGEPIAYITGKKEFYGLEYEVDKNVLIPRPETELLVELALKKIQTAEYEIPDTLIDIGTGSGNIVVSIAKNIPAKQRKKMQFYATDISKEALFMAKKNAKRHKVAKNIKFVQSDLLEFANKKKIGGNITIVANLPYVSDSLYKKNKHNLKYEPKKALLSKKGGLRHYEKMLRQIKKIIQITNYRLLITALLEISPEQKTALAKIAKRELPLAKIKFLKDLSGKWRIAKLSVFVDKKCP